MSTAALIVILLSPFLGALLQCLSGFGAGVTFMVLLPYAFNVVQSATLSQTICLILNIIAIGSIYKYVNKKVVIWQVVIYYPVYFICIQLSKTFDPNFFRPYLGIFFMALAIFCLITDEKVVLKANTPLLIISGLLCGVFGAFFGAMGPIIAIYMLAACKEKDEYIASLQMYFLLTNIFAMGVRIYAKQLTMELVPYIAIGSVTLLIGYLVGRKISKKIKMKSIKRWAYVMVGVSGLITFLKCVL